MVRDLVRFLDHTNSHVIERIKSSHPEWAAENGVCEKCEEYYKLELQGGSELVNIGRKERIKRIYLGMTMSLASLFVFAGLSSSGSPRPARLLLSIPVFLAFFGFAQAKEKTCALHSFRATRNMDLGTEKINDKAQADILKLRGRKILLFSLLAAFAVGLLFFLIP